MLHDPCCRRLLRLFIIPYSLIPFTPVPNLCFLISYFYFILYTLCSDPVPLSVSSAVCCLLSVVCCLLSVVCCLLSAVCCLLVRCLLSVVCCLLSYCLLLLSPIFFCSLRSLLYACAIVCFYIISYLCDRLRTYGNQFSAIDCTGIGHWHAGLYSRNLLAAGGHTDVRRPTLCGD
jgi:hypothetical protein